MITVNNLSKVFRTEEIETTALNDVSFESKNGKEVIVTRSQKDAGQAQRTIDISDGQIVSDVKNEL